MIDLFSRVGIQTHARVKHFPRFDSARSPLYDGLQNIGILNIARFGIRRAQRELDLYFSRAMLASLSARAR
jgi:hypothetical protein